MNDNSLRQLEYGADQGYEVCIFGIIMTKRQFFALTALAGARVIFWREHLLTSIMKITVKHKRPRLLAQEYMYLNTILFQRKN